MQTGRLFEIIYLLMERKTMTTSQLAAKLEVSTRTIRRDIEALSGAGIPVYMTRGRGGGVHLLEGYVLDKSLMSDAEQDEILAALSTLEHTGATDTNGTRDRIARIFRREPVDWLDIDFSFWGAPAEYKRTFALIKQAIWEKHLLRFSYLDAAGNATRRTVEPARLVYKESRWYVRAYCLERDAWRTFKLYRINWESLETLPDRFVPRPVPESLDESYEQPPHAAHLKLLFEQSAADRVREEFAPSMIEFLDDGRLLVELTCALDIKTRFYLLSFGSALEVLEPQLLRDFLCDQAACILNRYPVQADSS